MQFYIKIYQYAYRFDLPHDHAETEVESEGEIVEGGGGGASRFSLLSRLEEDCHSEGVCSEEDGENDGESSEVIGHCPVHHCDQVAQTLCTPGTNQETF